MEINTRHRYIISILLSLIPFLMGIGIDLYVPSLPAIASYFKVESHAVQLTIGVYMFGYAIGQIFLGILSDTFGRRKIIILSGLFYTLTSLLSAFSPTIYMLIVYRFLQGLGIAGLGVVARAIASDCFSGLDLAKSLATFSLSWAIGPILGPFIGGYIQHYFNWQTNFYLFTLLGLAVFIFSLVALPETHIHKIPFHPKKIFSTLKTMLCNPIFLLGSIIASLAYSILVIFNVVGPFLVQIVLKYSAVDYGKIALLLGLGYFLGNSFNRFIIHHIKPIKVAFIAIICTLAISLCMIIVSILIKINLWIILLPVITMFFLCGLILPNMVASTVSLYPKLGGTVNAVVGSLTAGGVFLMTSVATLFKTQSQIPMALLYLAMALCSLVLYVITEKFKMAN